MKKLLILGVALAATEILVTCGGDVVVDPGPSSTGMGSAGMGGAPNPGAGGSGVVGMGAVGRGRGRRGRVGLRRRGLCVDGRPELEPVLHLQ